MAKAAERAVCLNKDVCGGCAYQGISYEEQLAIKYNEVKSLLDNKDIDYPELLAIEPAPCRYGYRNKMEYTFGDLVKNGPTTLGMHKKGHFMSIVTVDTCQLVHQDFNIILSSVLGFVNDHGYKHYHKKRHKGLMRNLIIRRGIRTGELLINIVTTSGDFSQNPSGADPTGGGIIAEADISDTGKPETETFDEKGFVELIKSLPLENNVVGILHTINDRPADAVYCDELRILYGRDYYNERIMGLNFRVSAFSFFQTNVEAIENLYTYAIDLIDDFEDKNVFDLYCGTGTITQVMARKASKVTGVEIVEESVEAARQAAAANGLDNCRFIAGDCFKVLDSLEEKPEVVIVDPPRAGIKTDALDKIISYGLDQIVYISCNPKTLVENLYYMQYCGYRVSSIKPFDNFPGTKHVECVALLCKHPKPYRTLDVDMDDYYRIKDGGQINSI